MKKKGRKLLITAAAFLLIGLILCGVALANGAGTVEFWQKVNEQTRVSQGFHAVPVQKSVSFAANEIMKLDIDTNGYGFLLKYGDVDDIQITYYEDFEAQSVVSNTSGTLKVHHAFKMLVLFIGNFGTYGADNFRTEITVPQGFNFQSSDIDVSGNKSDVAGVNLGAINSLSVSGGTLTMVNISAAAVTKASVSGGALYVNGGTVGALGKVTVSGGKADFNNAGTRGDPEISVSGGTVSLTGHTGAVNPLAVNVSGGSAIIDDGSFAGLSAKVSGGGVSIKNSSVTGNADIKVNGGSMTLTNCVFDAQNFTGKVSGGTITLDKVSGLKFYGLNVSGGRIYVKGLGIPADKITVLVSASGGGVYLNDSKMSNRAVVDPETTFDVKVSGGRVYIESLA